MSVTPYGQRIGNESFEKALRTGHSDTLIGQLLCRTTKAGIGTSSATIISGQFDTTARTYTARPSFAAKGK